MVMFDMKVGQKVWVGEVGGPIVEEATVLKVPNMVDDGLTRWFNVAVFQLTDPEGELSGRIEVIPEDDGLTGWFGEMEVAALSEEEIYV